MVYRAMPFRNIDVCHLFLIKLMIIYELIHKKNMYFINSSPCFYTC